MSEVETITDPQPIEISNNYKHIVDMPVKFYANIESAIPTAPFTDTEQTIYLLDDDTVSGLGVGITGGTTLSGWQYSMPCNHCTVIVGITSEPLCNAANSGIGMSGSATIAMAPTSYAEDGSMNAEAITSIAYDSSSSTPNVSEVYVQFDFEDPNDCTFLPVLVTPIIGGGMVVIDGVQVYCYCNAYIKFSNAIHQHGPDMIINIKKIVESTETTTE